MKKLLLLISLVTLALTTHAEIQSNGEAINKAGLQRMLGQRIVKCYIMVGSDVKSLEAQKELDEAIALFEQQHLELMDFAPNEKIEAALQKVSEIWMPFRLKAISATSKASAQNLIASSDKLFSASNDVVFLLEKHADTKAAKLVNISGKQRMLSQKIAKLYMAMSWRITNPKITNDFEKTLRAYENGLSLLKKSKQNTPEISKKLGKVTAQWEFSKAGFSQYKDGRYVPTIISVTTESMLKKMNELTDEYQHLSDKSK